MQAKLQRPKEMGLNHEIFYLREPLSLLSNRLGSGSNAGRFTKVPRADLHRPRRRSLRRQNGRASHAKLAALNDPEPQAERDQTVICFAAGSLTQSPDAAGNGARWQTHHKSDFLQRLVVAQQLEQRLFFRR